MNGGEKGHFYFMDIMTALGTRGLTKLHSDFPNEAISLWLRYVPVAMRPRLGS